MERENAWKSCNKQTVKEIFGFCEGYKKFISECKTERECTRRSIQMAEEHGYRNLKEIIAAKETIKSGDKVYADNMGKAIVLFNIGKKPIEEGLKILGAHIDSPRLDVKQNPLYEDSDLVLMDTHYYGGIKKYQWTTIPLALHGVVALTDGSVIDVEIGEKEKDPVVCVSDLLIHLAAEQMEKNGSKVVEGEALDLVVGNMPFNPKKDEKNPAKAYILDILKKNTELPKKILCRQSLKQFLQEKQGTLVLMQVWCLVMDRMTECVRIHHLWRCLKWKSLNTHLYVCSLIKKK